MLKDFKKILENLGQFYKILKDLKKILENFTKFYKILRKF